MRQLDVVPGRLTQVFSDWLTARPDFGDQGLQAVAVAVAVAVDEFTGSTISTTLGLAAATPVMDSFHCVELAGDALDRRDDQV